MIVSACLGTPVGPVPPGQTRVNTLAFAPDGGRIAAGIGPTVQLWSLAGCAEVRPGCGGEATVLTTDDLKAEYFSLAFDASGRTLFAGTGRGEIQRWDLDDVGAPQPTARLAGHEDLVLALLAGPGGRWLA